MFVAVLAIFNVKIGTKPGFVKEGTGRKLLIYLRIDASRRMSRFPPVRTVATREPRGTDSIFSRAAKLAAAEASATICSFSSSV